MSEEESGSTIRKRSCQCYPHAECGQNIEISSRLKKWRSALGLWITEVAD